MIVVQLFVNALLLAGTYLLLAVGLNLIFGVLRVVNFSHGGMVVFAGLFVYWLVLRQHVSPVLAVALAVVVVAAIGFVTQAAALARIRVTGYDAELLSLLATYGVALVLVNISALSFSADYVSLPELQGSWNIGSIHLGRAAVVAAAVGVISSSAVLFWLARTRSGKRVVATAQSETGAEVCGINAAVTKRVAFTLGSALAGLAGALTIFQSTMAPSAGLGYTVLAFVMIALGGLGNYAGAFLGALCLALLASFTSYYWSGTASAIAPYLLLLLVMLARTRGSRYSLV
ncbi:MAG TPA: branched-chain amino acid ABC transporter permease [Baekduia sp.]|nr:branched-chain amino acid ABC transporter permease [Baekduia sp.]